MYSIFIKDILASASEIAVKYFGKVSSSVKMGDNNQVLTEADLEIGRFIVKKIKDTYTTHNIIDEEAGVIDNKSELTWVVDPIDGTSNFANGLPHYGIMIGLLINNLPIAGGVSLPFYKEIYIAENGKGAFCNNKEINISKERNLLNSLVVYQIDGHQENPEMTHTEAKLLGKIILSIRNLRTTNSVFDVAMVASGKYGAILNKMSKIWDNVAQQVIIEEAGGIYTDFYGNPIDYSNPLSKVKDNFTYCAGAPRLHQQLIDIIKSHE